MSMYEEKDPNLVVTDVFLIPRHCLNDAGMQPATKIVVSENSKRRASEAWLLCKSFFDELWA